MKARHGFTRNWLLGGTFLDAQPSWSKKLFWFVGLPAWFLWGWFVVSGKMFEEQTLALVVFGVFGAVAAVGNFYFFRALIRGEL